MGIEKNKRGTLVFSGQGRGALLGHDEGVPGFASELLP